MVDFTTTITNPQAEETLNRLDQPMAQDEELNVDRYGKMWCDPCSQQMRHKFLDAYLIKETLTQIEKYVEKWRCVACGQEIGLVIEKKVDTDNVRKGMSGRGFI